MHCYLTGLQYVLFFSLKTNWNNLNLDFLFLRTSKRFGGLETFDFTSPASSVPDLKRMEMHDYWMV